LRVGLGKEFLVPSIAADFAGDGDVVEIDQGTYDGDTAIWRANNLTIRAAGKRVHLRAQGASAEGKAIWVVKGNNTTIENIEFSGAKVSARNGAGIRLEGAGLTLRRCYFHDNETGILTGANAASDVLIENSEFAGNGAGDGMSHNIYVGAVRSFTLRFSYIHHAVVGHNVKSRAARNYVLYNRVTDEQTGNSSYLVEFPNGGLAYVIGNLLQKGVHAENTTLVSYGAEGLVQGVNKLYIVNNTLVNERPEGGKFVFAAAGTSAAMAVNNIFAGRGTVAEGPLTLRSNLTGERSDLLEAGQFDYRLKRGARAVAAGEDPGEAEDFSLRAEAEYVHPLSGRKRAARNSPDLGAYSFAGERPQ
jgi:hypothetical protein